MEFAGPLENFSTIRGDLQETHDAVYLGVKLAPDWLRVASQQPSFDHQIRERVQTRPFALVAAEVLTMKVHEGGRVFDAFVLVVTSVGADGRREVLCE